MSDRRDAAKADGAKMTPRRHFLGLDLGQRLDPSALVVLEDCDAYDERSCEWDRLYAVRHIKRWPLGTRYTEVVAGVARVVRSPKLLDPVLVVDCTGCGLPVGEMLDDANFGTPIRKVLITSGHKASCGDDGIWSVGKTLLVSGLQSLLQRRRLTVAALPERELLVRELLAFKVKISQALNELYGAWREGEHDDIVLATALAVWRAGPLPDDTAEDAQPFAISPEPDRPWFTRGRHRF